jgi:sec-independent protein translocase protein TatA
MIGSQDLMVGLVIALFFFGAKKLPELAGSVGKSMKEFKKGLSSDADEDSTKAAVAVSRSCGSCQAPLESNWHHCPRCGAPAPGGSPPSLEQSA